MADNSGYYEDTVSHYYEEMDPVAPAFTATHRDSLCANPSYISSHPQIPHSRSPHPVPTSPPPLYETLPRNPVRDQFSTTVPVNPKKSIRPAPPPPSSKFTPEKSLPVEPRISLPVRLKSKDSVTSQEDVPTISPRHRKESEFEIVKRNDSKTTSDFSLPLEEQQAVITSMVPSGFNVMDLFSKENIIFLVPETSQQGLPITTSGDTVQGGGSYGRDDCKFEVIIPREHASESVIALRNVKNKERYLSINHKGKIKARNGYKDNCDFFVNVVGDAESSIVSLESARTDGLFLGIKANQSAADGKSITGSCKEAHFTIRADRILNPRRTLTVFGRYSFLTELTDRCLIRLFSYRRFLGIDTKGRVVQTHNSSNHDSLFTVFDRGMGVVSLRSYKYTGYWLRVDKDGTALGGKGILGPDGFFYLKENCDGDRQVCFESVLYPGKFILPPIRSPQAASPDFTLEVVQTLPN